MKRGGIYILLLSGVIFLFLNQCSGGNNPTGDGGVSERVEKSDSTSCQFSSECSCDQYCRGNVCREIVCRTSSDCRCGWKCVAGKCYDPKDAPCQSDKDCDQDPLLWKCDNGQCVNGGCRSDSECTDPKKPICNLKTHQCEAKRCTSNQDCPNPLKPICDKNTGECKPDDGTPLGGDCSQKRCKLGLFCYSEGNKKICRQACKPPQDNRCPAGTVCIETPTIQADGLCLPPGDGLKEGEDCSGGKKCQRHLKCAFGEDGERCRLKCTSDDHCDNLTQSCQKVRKVKLCMPLPSPCGFGRSCPGEDEGWEICLGGQCKLLLCPDDYKCPPTHKCNPNGRCIPRECPKDPCEKFYICKNNRCVKTNEGEVCGQNTKIPPDKCGKEEGLICAKARYVSACLRKCTTGTCPANFVCTLNADKQRVCLEKCDINNKKCSYPGYTCMMVKNHNPPGYYCVPSGQPIGQGLLQECSATKKCLPDLQCFMGYNARVGYCTKPCTTTADCENKPNAVCVNYFSFGRKCYIKCPTASFRPCTFGTAGRGYCSYATSYPQRTYICRPN